MTLEERIALLEKRVAHIEQVTTLLSPFGPTVQAAEQLEQNRTASIKRIVDTLLPGSSPAPPVDYSARVLTDGSPVTPDHTEIDPRTGLQKAYVVLSKEERDKGFVRPVRSTYTHTKCHTDTTMGVALAETYARSPDFYSGTYCAQCRGHFPVGETGEFMWAHTTEKVGT
jgi:uncharacterized coiled-coil protein SlyX